MELMGLEEAKAAVKNGKLVLPPNRVLSAAARQYLRRGRVELLRAAPAGEKPEDMTHLDAAHLVRKNHPRIRLRGKMDSLQAQLVLTQAALTRAGENAKIIDDLQGILDLLRRATRAEVLDEPLGSWQMLGLTPAQLREQSHNTPKFFAVDYMTLPHWRMGLAYARLNLLRTQARELETLAVTCFQTNATPAQRELLTLFNRLSSGFHIMMCRVLAGEYGATH